MTLTVGQLPPHMQESARAYVEEGQVPGDFLMAVLSNNLVEAAGRADEENQRALFVWADWLYNDVPMGAWGSLEKVREWIAAKRAAK